MFIRSPMKLFSDAPPPQGLSLGTAGQCDFFANIFSFFVRH
jgi:hypothetical protein